MSCCCFSFCGGLKATKNKSFSNDNFAIERAMSTGLKSQCNCRYLDHPNLACSCEYSTPTSAAALMKKSRGVIAQRDTTESSDDPLSPMLPTSFPITTEVPLATMYKVPSTSTQSYRTAKSSNPADDTADEIDFTDDTCIEEDDSQELRYSIDAAEASNIVITGQKEFYDTVCDSPVKYQDRFGRSQSMRRYSSAITDRHILALQQQQQHEDHFVDLDPEPLELSCQYAEDSTTQFASRLHSDAIAVNEKLSYVEELRERLPEIRSNLRPTFPEFARPEDIGKFLASNPTAAANFTNYKPMPSVISSVTHGAAVMDINDSPRSYSTAYDNSPLAIMPRRMMATRQKPHGGPDVSTVLITAINGADVRGRRNSD